MSETKNDVMVIKHSLAKMLLREGFIIKDLRKKRNLDGTIDTTRAVYIFEYKEGIEEAINRLK